VGYETLVRKIAKANLDKSSRFTDWSRRPLSDAQKVYALADVTHLRPIYEFLAKALTKVGPRGLGRGGAGRPHRPRHLHRHRPEEAWLRIKTRTNSGRFLAVVKELARFRETFARDRNIPRSRVYKDDALLELASAKPRSLEADLNRSRLLLREARKGEIADGILAAVRLGLEMPADETAQARHEPRRASGQRCAGGPSAGAAQGKVRRSGRGAKLIANASELDEIAAGVRTVPALKGWRAKVFGDDALRLCAGKVALTAQGRAVGIVEL
jgi:ribonuclease D